MGAKATKIVTAMEVRAGPFFAKAKTQEISNTLTAIFAMGLKAPNMVAHVNSSVRSDLCR
jgi:hypothetical protein